MQVPEILTHYASKEPQNGTASGSVLGKDDFLRLLLTQLQHQDPQNPLDDREFTTQLAQFSSLEQMNEIGNALGELKTLLADQGRFSLLQGVGKTARTKGNALVPEPGGGRGTFELPGAAASVEISLYDSSGTTLRTIPLGALSAGEHSFPWDGLRKDGVAAPPGTYFFSVDAVDAEGKPLAATTYLQGTVTGVSLGDPPTVYIAGIPVPYSGIDLWKGGEPQ